MVWVGKYLKNHLILPPYHGQGHLPWPFTCSESCATAEFSEDKTLFQALGLAAECGSACSTFPNQSPTTACWVMWTLEWTHPGLFCSSSPRRKPFVTESQSSLGLKGLQTSSKSNHGIGVLDETSC